MFAGPGYFVAIRYIDPIGRQTIRHGVSDDGTDVRADRHGPSVIDRVAPFVILFGISYFFTEFGPNTTTFIYPAEIFPTDVRTRATGSPRR